MTKTITSTPPSKSKRRDKKRKHRKVALDNDETKTLSSPNTPSTAATSTHKRRRTANPQFLNGMVIAISTLVTGEDNNEGNTAEKSKASAPDDLHLHSYRQVADDCRSNGAKVSAQVHKKVHCLLCTSAAIAQSTQRVRKALKNQVPLVDVSWLYHCLEQEEKLSFEGFLLQQPSSNTNEEVNEDEVSKKEKKRDKKKKKAKKSQSGDNNLLDNDHDNEPLPDAGWTEPVAVGCCCVCHDTGDTANCEWCPDCK